MEGPAKCEAVVLAAGGSTRLGRSKALLEFDGLTALELVLRAVRTAGVTSGVVVTGEADDALRRAVDPAPFQWVRNPFPEEGRTGSVLIGLGATTADTDVLLWPVDRPLASTDTVRALLAPPAGPEDVGEGVVVPECEGRRGHPLRLRARIRPALLAAPPDASLRDVIRASGLRRRVVAVEDPGIHFDLDTEDDWKRALDWWRSR